MIHVGTHSWRYMKVFSWPKSPSMGRRISLVSCIVLGSECNSFTILCPSHFKTGLSCALIKTRSPHRPNLASYAVALVLRSPKRVGRVVPATVYPYVLADLVWVRIEQEAPSSLAPANSTVIAGRPVSAVEPSRLQVAACTTSPDCLSVAKRVILRGQTSRRPYSNPLISAFGSQTISSRRARPFRYRFGLVLVGLDELNQRHVKSRSSASLPTIAESFLPGRIVPGIECGRMSDAQYHRL